MSPELQPMAVQYYYHVSPSRDQYTALPLEGVLVMGTDEYILHMYVLIILPQFYVNSSRQERKIDVL